MSTDNEKHIQEIIQGITEFKMIPFFGSGMSARFGIKTWGDLIETLRIELSTSTTDFLDVAQEYEDTFGREALIQKIKSETGETLFNDEDLEVHNQILAMKPPVVYTTNWDNSIETAADRSKINYLKISSLTDIVNAPHHASVIVKFHGDFDHPENIVFTRSSYQKRLEVQHPFDILFRAHILGKGVLFLGYSFSDENIDYIFTHHNTLYGTEQLPKSYIIAFKDKYNQEKADELLKKNIVTIVLDSREELGNLITKVNSSVFNKSYERQMLNMMKPFPSEVLLKSELENLRSYIGNPGVADEQKADKLREIIEWKQLSPTIEKELTDFLVELVSSSESFPINEAVLLAFKEIRFKDVGNGFNLAVELVGLTKYKELNFTYSAWSPIDTMTIIESRLTPVPTCMAIFLFLLRAIEQNEDIQEFQLRRIFEMLTRCKWDEIEEKDEGLTKAEQNKILNYYLKKFPKSAQWFDEPMFSKDRPTLSQQIKEMKKIIPQSIKKFGNQL